MVHIFLQKTRAGQVDVAVYGTVVKSGWGEVCSYIVLLVCLIDCCFSVTPLLEILFHVV